MAGGEVGGSVLTLAFSQITAAAAADDDDLQHHTLRLFHPPPPPPPGSGRIYLVDSVVIAVPRKQRGTRGINKLIVTTITTTG